MSPKASKEEPLMWKEGYSAWWGEGAEGQKPQEQRVVVGLAPLYLPQYNLHLPQHYVDLHLSSGVIPGKARPHATVAQHSKSCQSTFNGFH